MLFEGYKEDENLPIRKGQIVTIKKGTVIRTMHPDPAKKTKIAGRTYKVKVHHVLNGMSEHKHVWDQEARCYADSYIPINNPSVRWPGEGGYWFEVDINDIPEATGKS